MGKWLYGTSVLVVDDDVCFQDTVRVILRREGIDVKAAMTGAEGIAMATGHCPDLIVVDFRLPDMTGLEMVRTLLRTRGSVRFVLISGFLDTAVTVEAMRLGALDVVDKPIMTDQIVAMAHRYVICQESTSPDGRSSPELADRWAGFVLKVCDTHHDVRTIGDWARVAGVSYSSLRESCRLLGIGPHDARDLARMLRALTRSASEKMPPEVFLAVSDGRTLSRLLDRAAVVPKGGRGSVSIDRFLDEQQFVPCENAGLKALRRLIQRA